MTTHTIPQIKAIIMAHDNGIRITPDEKKIIAQYVFERVLRVGTEDVQIDEQIQSRFPKEWAEAQEAIDIRDGRKKIMYIATVTLAFFADSDGEACDAVSGMLSENLQGSGALKDWQYTPYNGTFPAPTCAGYKSVDMEEGEIFTPDGMKATVLVPEYLAKRIGE